MCGRRAVRNECKAVAAHTALPVRNLNHVHGRHASRAGCVTECVTNPCSRPFLESEERRNSGPRDATVNQLSDNEPPNMWPSPGSGFEPDPFSPAGSAQQGWLMTQRLGRSRIGRLAVWIILGLIILVPLASWLIPLLWKH